MYVANCALTVCGLEVLQRIRPCTGGLSPGENGEQQEEEKEKKGQSISKGKKSKETIDGKEDVAGTKRV